jgi:hypothetical protein
MTELILKLKIKESFEVETLIGFCLLPTIG